MLRSLCIAVVLFVFSVAANPPPAMAAFISEAVAATLAPEPPPLPPAPEPLPLLPPPPPPPLPVDPAEARALARVMYCEARGEGDVGMRAVAHVAMNRVEDGRWRDNLLDVLSQHAQFTCWDMLDQISYHGDAWRAAQFEARLALSGVSQDPTYGATHYHADYVHPRWARAYPRIATIGRHIFYA